jgi:hypothetical protein
MVAALVFLPAMLRLFSTARQAQVVIQPVPTREEVRMAA